MGGGFPPQATGELCLRIVKALCLRIGKELHLRLGNELCRPTNNHLTAEGQVIYIVCSMRASFINSPPRTGVSEEAPCVLITTYSTGLVLVARFTLFS